MDRIDNRHIDDNQINDSQIANNINTNINTNIEAKRTQIGMGCGIAGIILNLLVFAGKFLAGSFSGSVAIIADAFNNLSDAGSSIITLAGFKLSSQKPDNDHPYGHGRIEYISGLLVAVIIVIMAYELFKSSIAKIIHPESIVFSGMLVAILIGSILVKIVMFGYNSFFAKKINSSALKATAMDSLSDTVATTVVLFVTIIGHYTGINLDGYCGLVVSLLILWAGISAAKDTVGPLLGQAPSEEFVNKIEEIVLCDEHKELGVLGMHDLIVHDYGPGRIFMSLHVEVPASGDIMALHDMMDNIEHDLQETLRCHAVVHMDPVLVDDLETNRMKEIVESIISVINAEYQNKDRDTGKDKIKDRVKDKGAVACFKPITFHDFRIVKGPTHTNLIFDIVVPFDLNIKEDEIVKRIRFEVQKVNPSYYCVIEVDRGYV